MSESFGALLRYEAPGPVAERFLASRKPVQAIMGPIGSGKTGANLMKHVYNAIAQKPSTRDGMRKYKLCVVRDTYRQLWQTTLPSWWRWMPRESGQFTGAQDAPAQHVIRMRLPDQTRVFYTVDFIAIGEHKVEDVLRGYEPTAFYLNEVDRLAREVFLYARGRAGRYPPMDEGGPDWYGVTADFNAPDVDSWLYEDMFGHCPAEFDVFVQPSGFDAAAENLKNLPPGYYTNQAAGQPDWYVRRMIRNQFGASRDGKPVYEEFNDARHVAAEPLEALVGIPLIIGLDAGGHPAAAILQRHPNSQWRVLAELCGEAGTGPHRFGDDLARLLRERFPQHKKREDFEAYCDPSALYGADRQAGEQDWSEIVAKKIGLRVRAAPTNKQLPRIEAARIPLSRTIDGTQPGLIVSARCPVIRKAFNSGYRYRRIQVPGDVRYSEEPEKNDHSHPMEALQYGLSGGGEYHEVMMRNRRREGARRHRVITQADYERDGGRRGQ